MVKCERNHLEIQHNFESNIYPSYDIKSQLLNILRQNYFAMQLVKCTDINYHLQFILYYMV